MPSGSFRCGQLVFSQRSRQVSAPAHFFTVRNQPGHRRSVLKQYESDLLVMGAIDAIGEIARGIGDADGRLSHTIRLSNFQEASILGRSIQVVQAGD